MTKLTLMMFQGNYPEKIKIDRIQKDNGIYIYCYLLNDDGDIHTSLFDCGPFEKDEDIDKLINKLLSLEV